MDWSGESETDAYKRSNNGNLTGKDKTASDSIRVKCEFDSNVIDESDWNVKNILI
jgi:hypothetical protein